MNQLIKTKELKGINRQIDKRLNNKTRFELIYSLIEEKIINQFNIENYKTDFSIHFKHELYTNLIHAEKLLIFVFLRTNGVDSIFYKNQELESIEDIYLGRDSNIENLVNTIQLRIKFNDKCYLVLYQKSNNDLYDNTDLSDNIDSNIFICELKNKIESIFNSISILRDIYNLNNYLTI